MYVEKVKNKLIFRNLTYAPIDKDLIDLSLLNSHEKDYLLKYNLETYKNISKFLKKDERKWLLNSIY